MDMNPQDNVVKGVFDPLERRALRIEAAMKRRAKGDQEWIEGTIDLAVELAGAREEFTADQAFGGWFILGLPILVNRRIRSAPS